MIRRLHSSSWVPLLATCLAASAVSCGKTEAGPPTKPPPLVSTVTAQRRTLESTLDLTGTVEATRVARVASPAEGPVLAALVREGDTVKAGQVLVSIGRQAEAIAAVSSARESLALEKRNLERVEHLVAIGASAKEEVDRARLAVSQAEARLAAARQGSSDHQTRAPWSGVVSRVLVSDGAFVAPREPLVEMFDPSSLVIRIAAPEAFALRVREQNRAYVTLDARPGSTTEGAVSRLYPELDRRTRSRTIEVSLPRSEDLVPGMFARVRIVVEKLENVLAVPEEAVAVTPKGKHLAFVLADGKAQQREIEIGAEVDGTLQILTGLAPGERVIVRGQESLKDGAEVRTAKPQKPAGSSSSAHMPAKTSEAEP